MPILPVPPENYTRTHIKWSKPFPGWMELDAVLRQSVDHDGEITEHPVDTGAVITDHYRRINVPVILETIITNSPLELPLTHTGGAFEVPAIRIVEIPAPIFPGAPTSVGGFDITSKKRVQISTLDFTPTLDRVNAIYTELEKIQDEARVLTVSLGGFRDYDDMLLKRFTVDRDPEVTNGMRLSLEFKKVVFASVLTRNITNEITVSEPARSRSNKNSDKGKKSTEAVDTAADPSIAKRTKDAVVGLFGVAPI